MNTPTGSNGDKRIRSLDQLAQNIPPPRDLWPGIAAEIAKDAKGSDAPKDANPLTRMQWMALAAVVAALAVGVWVGRNVIPASLQSPQQIAADGAAQDVVTAAYIKDPR